MTLKHGRNPPSIGAAILTATGLLLWRCRRANIGTHDAIARP
jgi:hypothetical protein